MQSVIILPIPIPVYVPVAGNGWLKGGKRPWPLKPKPTSWPPHQPIPSPDARTALDAARRLLAETRRQRPMEHSDAD
jgi:hypothetical protein